MILMKIHSLCIFRMSRLRCTPYLSAPGSYIYTVDQSMWGMCFTGGDQNGTAVRTYREKRRVMQAIVLALLQSMTPRSAPRKAVNKRSVR
jgi:hypothetical protein